MTTVHVNLAERSYDIQIGSGNLAQAGEFLKGCGRSGGGRVSHAVLMTDANVEKTHAARVAESLAGQVEKVEVIVLEPGETSKSPEMAFSLWQGLLDLGADRKSVVVAVGGGVIGDLAGFVAATFARGLRFLQVPTSLLAQVDSSVGGKVGINLPQAKNMVGAFLQPVGVLIDTETLATLPEREFLAGLGEVVKYGVILDAELFAYLEAHAAELLARDRDVLKHVIARCCRLKADVVEKDEREETGLRAVLNYGHTFGHAFESLSGYGRLLHGEAVAIGMLCASRLAQRLGRIGAEQTRREQQLLSQLGLPVDVPKLDRKEILASMMHDKKVQHGRLRLILPTRIGHVELVEGVESDAIAAALEG